MDWILMAQCEGQSTILNFRIPYSAQNYFLTDQLLSIQMDSDPWNQFVCFFFNIIISMEALLYDSVHTDGL